MTTMELRLNTVLTGLGFSELTANYIVTDQRIDTLATLAEIRQGAATQLANNIRQDGQENGSNPGIKVNGVTLDALLVYAFYLRYQQCVQRTPVRDNIGEILVHFRQLLEVEQTRSEPKALPKIDERDWHGTIHRIEEYLKACRGVKGAPLAYVVREKVDLPGQGTAVNEPDGPYENETAEMIRRTAHQGTYFSGDNEKVVQILGQITDGHACSAHVRVSLDNNDARKAFQSLKDYYLGPHDTRNKVLDALHKLQSMTYTHEKRNWTFDKHVCMHLEQHRIIENAASQGYRALDDLTKVNYLVNSMLGPNMAIPKGIINSRPDFGDSFERSVQTFKQHLRQQGLLAMTTNQVHVGALGVEERFYKPEEFQQLTNEQKEELFRLRALRNGNRHKKTGKPRGRRDNRRQRRRAPRNRQDENPPNNDSQETTTGDISNNRNHPALQRN